MRSKRTGRERGRLRGTASLPVVWGQGSELGPWVGTPIFSKTTNARLRNPVNEILTKDTPVEGRAAPARK